MNNPEARTSTPKRVLIACNSRGRLLDACLDFAAVRTTVWGIVSDRQSASLAVAEKHGLHHFAARGDDDERLSDEIFALCAREKIGHIISTGYTRIFRGKIVDAFKGRMLNSHFSILPAFPGRRDSDWTTAKHPPRSIFERTLEFGARITGNTIHLIDHTIDGGAPVMQSSLVIPYGEDPGYTRHRLFIQECQCLMQIIIWIASGRLFLDCGRTPQIKDAKFDNPSFSPALEEAWIVDFNPPNLSQT
jgi:phosphoribosylglycinamide formyltransferase 1